MPTKLWKEKRLRKDCMWFWGGGGGPSESSELEWILEKRCDILDWAELAEGRQQWLSAVNVVMNPGDQ